MRHVRCGGLGYGNDYSSVGLGGHWIDVSIPRGILNSQLRDSDWLNDQYWNNNLSMNEIGENFGVSPKAVAYWMNKHGIKTRSTSQALRIRLNKNARPKWEPGNLTEKSGLHWPDHPLASSTVEGIVREHHLVVWQKSGYDPYILELLNDGAHVHHRNGKRDDNRSENLELRICGQHPRGVGESDMVRTLDALGYTVHIDD